MWTLSDFPNEILQLIFVWLSGPDDLARTASVCRRFWEVAINEMQRRCISTYNPWQSQSQLLAFEQQLRRNHTNALLWHDDMLEKSWFYLVLTGPVKSPLFADFMRTFSEQMPIFTPAHDIRERDVVMATCYEWFFTAEGRGLCLEMQCTNRYRLQPMPNAWLHRFVRLGYNESCGMGALARRLLHDAILPTLTRVCAAYNLDWRLCSCGARSMDVMRWLTTERSSRSDCKHAVEFRRTFYDTTARR